MRVRKTGKMEIPQYILNAKIQSDELNYDWDDLNLDHVFKDNESEEYHQKVANISYRASTALTVAIGEWIIHRYRNFKEAQLPDPDQMIEAGWAGMVDGNYHSRYKPDVDPDIQDIWKGPVMFPIAIANIIIIDAIDEQMKESANTSPTSIACLARHVLPDAAPFVEWRDSVLDRLVEEYPYDEEETLGEVVPREFFDLNTQFDINQTELLIQQFLSTLDHKVNYYLNSPELMKEFQFKGDPYQFSIESDRKEREEW